MWLCFDICSLVVKIEISILFLSGKENVFLQFICENSFSITGISLTRAATC